jgi:3-carboxy-cis,cis-muconate cycloisomerase
LTRAPEIMPPAAIHSEIDAVNFGTDEMRSIFSDASGLQRMLDVEAALARAGAAAGLVPRPAADRISAASRLDKIDIARVIASVRTVGYPVVGLVNELRAACDDDAARYIHLGATTQDIMDTATVLQVRAASALVRRDLIAVARTLAARAREYHDTPMAGRTHLQQAVPITFGMKCAVWAAPLARGVKRLDQAIERCSCVQFGGAAGTLAALGDRGLEVANALAAELGLSVPPIPWHVARDGFAEAVAVLGIICGSLAKFALDITLLAQTEVAEVAEGGAQGRGGSSTMPQKRNPIASEYIIAAARNVHAMVPVMLGAMIQEHERATGAWQSERLAIAQAFVLSAGALAEARTVAETMTVDAVQMRANLDADGGLIMAEAVATALTPALGRAAAHEAVEHACARAIQQRTQLREVISADPMIRAHLSEDEIRRATDPSSYLGSAGSFVDRVVAEIEALS